MFLHPAQLLGRRGAVRRPGDAQSPGQGVRLHHPARRRAGRRRPRTRRCSDNKRFRVVWEVLNALRAHDDRFNAMINSHQPGQASDGNDLRSDHHRQPRPHRPRGRQRPPERPAAVAAVRLWSSGGTRSTGPDRGQGRRPASTGTSGPPTSSTSAEAQIARINAILASSSPAGHRGVRAVPDRAAGQPQRLDRRRRGDLDAQPAPDHRTGVRRPVRARPASPPATRSRSPCNT